MRDARDESERHRTRRDLLELKCLAAGGPEFDELPDDSRSASSTLETEPEAEFELYLEENTAQRDSIVLATDLSKESKRAFVPTAVLARELGMQLILLHVVQECDPGPHGSPFAVPVELPGLPSPTLFVREELEELATYLGGGSRPVVIAGADIVQSIIGFANGIEASFVAISTHGHSGFRPRVVGSVADALIRRSKIPILCFPRD